MSLHFTTLFRQAAPPLWQGPTGFALHLIDVGALSSFHLAQFKTLEQDSGTRLIDFVLSRELMTEDRLYAEMRRYFGCGALPEGLVGDPGLVAEFGTCRALDRGLYPFVQRGGLTHVVATCPEEYLAQLPDLTARYGRTALCLAPRDRLEENLHALTHGQMILAAETRLDVSESCRDFPSLPMRWAAAGLALILGLCLVLAPGAVLLALTLCCLLAALAFNALKLRALILDLSAAPAPIPIPLAADRLPIISVLVPLYKEQAIAQTLIRRLSALDYPQDRLDILLVVEAEDAITRATILRNDLPPSMRVIAVPRGGVRTKPRAMNYALDFCRGEIVGIYDAEDQPHPQQLRRIAARFANADDRLACLQGYLDFYNPHHNWISRCFTIEYAAWFRILLPGIAKSGLAVPLGGTTLFFRRAALEALGRWDAHNVTEDADLGMRIYRKGYRTELIDIVTREEAMSDPRGWVKQRSRWIKGFMLTWASLMKSPAKALAELGFARFLGAQMLLLGSVLQSLLAPTLWLLLLLPLGLSHPLEGSLGPGGMRGLLALFLGIEVLLLWLGFRAISRSGHALSRAWVLTMPAYYALATLAAYKALWELVTQPFYWDKTQHGAFSGLGPGA